MTALATKVAAGNTIPYTPSGSDVAAGDVVVQGELCGIATEPIPDGIKGALHIEGVFYVKKDEATAFSAGDVCYWDAADSEAQDTADTGTNKQLGKATLDAASDDTHMYVKLTP